MNDHKRTSFLLIFLALAAQVMMSGCSPNTPQSSQAAVPPIAVQVAQLKHGPIMRFVALPGEIRSYQEAALYAKVGGYLKTISVDKGDHVNAGDLIADIEVPELLADMNKFKAEVTLAELDFKRLSESQKKFPDLVVPQTLDDAKAKLDIGRANLERTMTMIGYAKIIAPFSGVITKRMVDPGAFIPAATSGSAATNAAIVTLTDLSRVRVEVGVPELEAPLVVTGLPARFSVDGLPGRNFEGKVTRFAYSLDAATKTMLTEIEMENPNFELRPGMYALVKIGLERKEDALLAPVETVAMEKAGPYVFTASNGKARKARVQTGFNDGANIEIIAGLKPDEPVVVIGKRQLSDGQALQITEGK